MHFFIFGASRAGICYNAFSLTFPPPSSRRGKKCLCLFMNEDLKLLKKLDELKNRHRELDEQITQLSRSTLNQLLVMRLKKEKLTLRDEIGQLERLVYPDITA